METPGYSSLVVVGSNLGRHQGGGRSRGGRPGKIYGVGREERKRKHQEFRMNLMNFGHRETMVYQNCFSCEQQTLNLNYQRKQGLYHLELLKSPGYRSGSHRINDVVRISFTFLSFIFLHSQQVERWQLQILSYQLSKLRKGSTSFPKDPGPTLIGSVYITSSQLNQSLWLGHEVLSLARPGSCAFICLVLAYVPSLHLPTFPSFNSIPLYQLAPICGTLFLKILSLACQHFHHFTSYHLQVMFPP